MPAANLADVYDYIGKLYRTKFFGTIELTFQHGHVVHVKETRSLRPEDGLTVRVELPPQPKAEGGGQ